MALRGWLLGRRTPYLDHLEGWVQEEDFTLVVAPPTSLILFPLFVGHGPVPLVVCDVISVVAEFMVSCWPPHIVIHAVPSVV